MIYQRVCQELKNQKLKIGGINMLEESNYLSNNNSSIYRKSKQQITEFVTIYTPDSSFDLDNIATEATETNDGQTICAKTIHRSNGTNKYLIRLDTNGKLFNPISIYGVEQNKTFLDRVCRSNQKFKEVSEKVMTLYIRFLNQKNPALLNNAEREAE